MPPPRNVFEWIKLHGTDDGFEPQGECYPCRDRPGSCWRIWGLENRVQAGVPLWHPEDKTCFPEGGPC